MPSGIYQRTEDHIIPLSMGGTDYIENIQPLCQSCNTRKHATAVSFLPISEIYDHDGVHLLGGRERE